jgi:phosphoribosylformylglycinamidine cyclo-ligase
VTLAGGETASLPGIVTELDLSGTALGWLPKGMAITGANISDGDVMIGLPASGIHSNGFSLVRKVVELSGCAYTDPAPFATEFAGREIVRMKDGGVTLGEVLLNPTRIYVDPVTDLIDACRAGSGPCPADALHGICHVTGGGLSNLLRLHDSLGWHIDNPMPSLPEFDWVQTTGGITDREMARTFNLGMGMVLVVDSEHANAVCDWVATRLEGTQIVGSVCNHGHKVTHVNPEIVFEHY